MVLDFHFVVITEKIVAQAIDFRIEDILEFGFQGNPLRRIDIAFKNGILGSLAIVLASLRDLAESSFSGSVNGIDVITNDNHHGRNPI